ncbi:MAG: ATP-binding protein [Lachnospiraceae bacterium]|nr:ATP-binding protein [Lachnospiraceae bacterium]
MNCTYSDSNQKKIETYSVIIYSLYTITLVILSVRREGSPWDGILMTCGILLAWIVYVGKFRTYVFRAAFYVVVMQSILILHASKLEDFTRALPVLLVFVVMVSLYGIAELIYIPTVGILIVFIIHVFFIKSYADVSPETVYTAIALLLNAGLLERVMYTSTRMNKAGSEQLLGVIDELERVEQSKDDFLANVSHEIRTPLNTICGMSELLLQKELPDSVQEDIRSIQTSGRMLMSVVSDILDFSELLSGRIELEEEAYSITSTINDVINMTSARRGNKPIELIVDCDANIPCALYGDEKKLRRVIMNLIDNAIKFTEEGCISLLIGYRRESYGINLMVAVKDTGIGMDEKSQDKLFAGFNQADTGRNRQKEGVGLGLAISRALVQKMGGAIMVKSRLGKGTCIRFTVPLKVLDERPIATISNRDEINVAVYVDMEKYMMEMVRDEYDRCITHMVEQLKGRCHICRNLAELQRREKREELSHVFVSETEYLSDRDYFDTLADKTKLVVMLDRAEAVHVTNPKVLKIYKPLYILTIVSVLNGLYNASEDGMPLSSGRFTTKDVHVLVVDDNRMNIMVMEALLANYRIKVTTALSGAEALTKITSENYDCVFMDHMMPEMDGVETLHRIRHLVGSYYRRVPVIALTANAVAGVREMFLTEGFQDFIEKPVECSVLERLLKRVIPAEKIILQEDVMEEPKDDAEMPEVKELKEILSRYDLDANSGLLYCNGKEHYIKILQNFCKEAGDSAELVERLFREQDWNQYTIAVHGIKGAMRSIGANKVSELAKELEFAGREGRIAFITGHHARMIEEYRKLLEGLQSEKWLCPEDTVAAVDSVPDAALEELDEAAFEQKIEQMENAVYSLDEETFLAIFHELKSYLYRNVALHTALGPIQKKVDGASYISAVELLAKLKKTLDNVEGN